MRGHQTLHRSLTSLYRRDCSRQAAIIEPSHDIQICTGHKHHPATAGATTHTQTALIKIPDECKDVIGLHSSGPQNDALRWRWTSAKGVLTSATCPDRQVFFCSNAMTGARAAIHCNRGKLSPEDEQASQTGLQCNFWRRISHRRHVSVCWDLDATEQRNPKPS